MNTTPPRSEQEFAKEQNSSQSKSVPKPIDTRLEPESAILSKAAIQAHDSLVHVPTDISDQPISQSVLTDFASIASSVTRVEADLAEGQSCRSRSEHSKDMEHSEPEDSGDREAEKTRYNYLIRYERADRTHAFVSRRGSSISVNPPVESQIDDDRLKSLVAKCNARRCGLLRVWEDEIIGYTYMCHHLKSHHKTFAVVKNDIVDFSYG